MTSREGGRGGGGDTRPRVVTVLAALTMTATLACATTNPSAAQGADTSAGREAPPGAGSAIDTAGQAMVPPGFGSLKQDDLAFHIDASGVLVRAVPLDESVIRLLTPDSYRALRDLKESYRKAINTVARRHNGRRLSVWLVSFYGVQADVRFTPSDISITSAGREFQPYEVLSLTGNFGEQQLRQRETQSALYLFDGDIELDQPVTVTYQRLSDDSWEETLQDIERERALIRARASKPR